MRISTFLPLMAILAFLSLNSCSTEEYNEDISEMDIDSPPLAKPIEIEILELINEYRITNGLSTLTGNGTVKAVAFTHTDYMIEVDNVSHDNFFVRKQSLQENANAIRVSENVAYGYTTASSVVNAWINSPGHRENIVGNFTDFDISAEQDEDGNWYYTNIFIKR